MKQKHSLKKVVLFLLISFAIVMPISIGVISSYNFYNIEINTVIHNQKQTLKQINIEVSELLEKIDRISNYMKSNYKKENRLIEDIVEINEYVTSIIILNKNGNITDFYTTENTNIYKGFDYSNKEYFKQIDNGKDFFWSNMFFSTINETQSLSYSFKIGEDIGVIFISIEDIESLVKIFKNKDGSHMIKMYDNNGIVILNPEKPDLNKQRINVSSKSVYTDLIKKVKPFEHTTFLKDNLSGVDFGMYTNVKRTGWSIVARTCYGNILDNLQNIIMKIIGIVLLFIIVSTFIIIRVSKILFSSLDELETISLSIASGRYNTKIRDSYFKEFNGLINGFKNMQHEIKKREVSLQKSVKSFESLIDSTMEGIILHENEICFDVNDIVVKLLGYDNKDEMIGKNALDFIAASSYDIVKSKMLINSDPYEIKMIRKDGSEFEALVQGKFIEINNKLAKVSAVIDITEIKEKDKILFQQSKMASMGEMIGNIAHQWRQPLNLISTVASGIKFEKEFGIKNQKNEDEGLDMILNSTNYLSQTIDDFRNFFKPDKQAVEINLIHTYEKVLKLISSRFKDNSVEIISNIEDIKTYTYENMLIQVIINILNNAFDALEEKQPYKKFVFLDIQHIKKSDLLNCPQLKEEEYIQIKIKDNAGGIPKDIIDKVFEIYFTTKHKSRGTGVGLYMTYEIIKFNMEGEIDVRNIEYEYEDEHYRGAEFTIYLPLKNK